MSKADSCRNPAPERKETARSRMSAGLLLALMSCLALLWALPAHAQKSSGQITGSVVDQNGAALPEAKIVVTQIGTNLTREVKTNQDGIYSAPDLPIGAYRVSATQSGFKETVVEGAGG